MVAFIIIFFIILVFVGLVASIAVQKGVGKNEIGSVEDGFRKVEMQRDLIGFLNREVIVDGKLIKVKDEILVLIEPYFNEELVKKIDLKNINDLNLKRPMINQETLVFYKIDKTREDNLIEILRSNLDNSCSEYIFKFPFGYFYRNERGAKFSYTMDGVSGEFEKILGDFVVIEIPYKNQKIEIKLKSRYVC
ncbi:MAG: hypothetical protein WC584_03100 [Candidatus Pacearchaeota archaeon]